MPNNKVKKRKKMKIQELICKLFGHKWNEYSKRSAYGKLLCNRCGYEQDKVPQ